MIFDTLAFTKKLEAAGMADRQAETVAEAIHEALDENFTEVLFTKQDAISLKAELKQDGASLKAELKQDGALLKSELKADIFRLESEMLRLKSEIIMWVIGLLFAQTAIMVSILKFFH